MKFFTLRSRRFIGFYKFTYPIDEQMMKIVVAFIKPCFLDDSN